MNLFGLLCFSLTSGDRNRNFVVSALACFWFVWFWSDFSGLHQRFESFFNLYFCLCLCVCSALNTTTWQSNHTCGSCCSVFSRKFIKKVHQPVRISSAAMKRADPVLHGWVLFIVHPQFLSWLLSPSIRKREEEARKKHEERGAEESRPVNLPLLKESSYLEDDSDYSLKWYLWILLQISPYIPLKQRGRNVLHLCLKFEETCNQPSPHTHHS